MEEARLETAHDGQIVKKEIREIIEIFAMPHEGGPPMNVKDLIFSIPTAALAEAYVAKREVPPEKRDRAVERVTAFIQALKDRDPKDTNHLILGIQFIDDDEDDGRREFLDACLFKKDDLSSQFDWDSPLSRVTSLEGLADEQVEELAQTRLLPDSYAYDLSPWVEILGYEVDPNNILEVGAVPLAVAVLWEMTFFGFDEARVDAEREELRRRAREMEEILKLPKEEREKYFIPAEKVFAELGIPENTEEEEREDSRRICRKMAENSLRKYRAMRAYLERQGGN